ncbi:hypothetical protein BDZ97DRAFT_2067923 [Flammula alnicola]|nr:hypothetical protein BDZ97DRAFT_2067923 [Flammula alnicola]
MVGLLMGCKNFERSCFTCDPREDFALQEAKFMTSCRVPEEERVKRQMVHDWRDVLNEATVCRETNDERPCSNSAFCEHQESCLHAVPVPLNMLSAGAVEWLNKLAKEGAGVNLEFKRFDPVSPGLMGSGIDWDQPFQSFIHLVTIAAAYVQIYLKCIIFVSIQTYNPPSEVFEARDQSPLSSIAYLVVLTCRGIVSRFVL